MAAIVFAFLTVKAGKDEEVILKLKRHTEVTEVYETYGVFDILIKIEAETEKRQEEIQMEMRSNPHINSIVIAKGTRII